MKKKAISLLVAGLIGACPLSTYATDNSKFVQPKTVVTIINQEQLKQDHRRGEEDRRREEEERKRREHERSERERREREGRENERREKERREQERRELEQRERDRREQARREEERREYERRQREIREQERNDAGYIIHRTADVIYVAQRSTRRRQYYNGLSQAVAHQQKARQLYMRGFYRDAIFHSLRARRIAISVIQGNKEKWSGSWEAREDRYRHESPRDNDLDVKLSLIKIGDKEAVRISIDLDL